MMSSLSLLPFVDLTLLTETATREDVTQLCEIANHAATKPAGVCLTATWLPLAQSLINDDSIRLVTVANFPHGQDSLTQVTAEIQQHIAFGAQEIDVVFPYPRFLAEDYAFCRNFLTEVRQASHGYCLKIILETGAFPTAVLIRSACQWVIEAQADFVKTSTGRNYPGANLATATTLIQEIAAANFCIGLKLSGGIRDITTAKQYYALVTTYTDDKWLTPQHFRIGTSQWWG